MLTGDPVRMYLKEIGKVDLLTAADEVDLAMKIEAGLQATEQLEAEVDETLNALKQRDKLDSSREVAPLVPAEDAVHVDSTAHTIDEVVSIIEDLINQRR